MHDALIGLIRKNLNTGAKDPVTLRDILVEDDATLPIITVRLTDKTTITALYNLQNVRYLEPLDYWPANDTERSTSGCSPSTTAVNAAAQSTIPPNDRFP